MCRAFSLYDQRLDSYEPSLYMLLNECVQNILYYQNIDNIINVIYRKGDVIQLNLIKLVLFFIICKFLYKCKNNLIKIVKMLRLCKSSHVSHRIRPSSYEF